ncbi:MAG: right-handed parallel beta-helix repeat-containing protein [Holophagales bacterium]|nr:right-handed parallel beta-helix repeat-containing protein [Holophagales bacterium]
MPPFSEASETSAPGARSSRPRRLLVLVLLLLGGLLLVGAGLIFAPLEALEPRRSTAAEVAAFEARTATHFERIAQGRNLDLPFPEMRIPEANPSSEAKAELGRLLYFDPILSGDDTVSCAHCHHPDLGLSDNRGRSMGKGGTGLGPERSGGALLRRGSPTVWNAAYNHLQFWDGRAETLEEQAGKPIVDPAEMAEDPERLMEQLGQIPEYRQRFEQAFGQGGLTFENVTFAIAAFERTLTSHDSAFDRYARGDRRALSETERRGLNVFRSLETRCFECHNLPTFANPDFKVVGVPAVEGLDAPDLGRAEIAGGEAYNRAFKVPTLRNVALTAPYMHNGRFETLEEVIGFYSGGGGVGEGLDLPNLDDKIRKFDISDRETHDLIAFLHALSDESKKPEIPSEVPSGLPVVASLPNQSPELRAFEPVIEAVRQVEIRREGNRLFVEPGQRIQDAIDVARPGDVVEVAPGEYHETLTLDISDLTLEGRVEGDARPVLDGRGVLSDGAIGSGSNLVIQGFEVRDYTANGLMINLGTHITFRDLKVVNTGLYGIYPVEVVGVLVEGCEVSGARDAGIYVGQAKDIVVRDNVTHGNVTGIEIENSIDAVVENNEVYGNTGGILVFGLPNNPSKVARGCRVVGNRVIENNLANFADPTAIVSAVPAGTGILVLAADDVEITGNTIAGNRSFAVGVAGLDTLLGAGSEYDIDAASDRVWVYGNALEGNGTDPDTFVLEAGLDGADLLWDLQGDGNRFDQPEASRLPPGLPGSSWSEFRRQANRRLWMLLSKL